AGRVSPSPNGLPKTLWSRWIRATGRLCGPRGGLAMGRPSPPSSHDVLSRPGEIALLVFEVVGRVRVNKRAVRVSELSRQARGHAEKEATGRDDGVLRHQRARRDNRAFTDTRIVQKHRAHPNHAVTLD